MYTLARVAYNLGYTRFAKLLGLVSCYLCNGVVQPDNPDEHALCNKALERISTPRRAANVRL